MKAKVLLYLFDDDIRQIIIQHAENPQLEKALEIPGPTALTPEKAAYLADRLRTRYPMIANQIASHPDLLKK